MDKWKTIDTAPKEKDNIGLTTRIILGFAPDEEDYHLPSCEGFWSDLVYKDRKPCFVSCMDPDVPHSCPQPTHWMPLPAHPE